LDVEGGEGGRGEGRKVREGEREGEERAEGEEGGG